MVSNFVSFEMRSPFFLEDNNVDKEEIRMASTIFATIAEYCCTCVVTLAAAILPSPGTMRAAYRRVKHGVGKAGIDESAFDFKSPTLRH